MSVSNARHAGVDLIVRQVVGIAHNTVQLIQHLSGSHYYKIILGETNL